jgi:hypothetical protein
VNELGSFVPGSAGATKSVFTLHQSGWGRCLRQAGPLAARAPA